MLRALAAHRNFDSPATSGTLRSPGPRQRCANHDYQPDGTVVVDSDGPGADGQPRQPPGVAAALETPGAQYATATPSQRADVCCASERNEPGSRVYRVARPLSHRGNAGRHTAAWAWPSSACRFSPPCSAGSFPGASCARRSEAGADRFARGDLAPLAVPIPRIRKPRRSHERYGGPARGSHRSGGEQRNEMGGIFQHDRERARGRHGLHYQHQPGRDRPPRRTAERGEDAPFSRRSAAARSSDSRDALQSDGLLEPN